MHPRPHIANMRIEKHKMQAKETLQTDVGSKLFHSFSWAHNLEREQTDAFLHLGKLVCKVCNELVI